MKLKTKKIEVVDNVETGKEFRRQRERAGISLNSVAKKAGVSAAYLSDLERGRRNWTAKKWDDLVAARVRLEP